MVMADRSEKSTSITVTVRTLAGHAHDFTVHGHDRVDKVVREAVSYFVGTGELAAGPYGLAVVRGGTGVTLEDAGRLDDAGVGAGDVLTLVSKQPQVDGNAAPAAAR